MERYKEIERSLITSYRKKIWNRFIEAINVYDMIQDGDKIAVCISGGKDSMLLAKCFQELYNHGKRNFELVFLVMNPGYNEINKQKIISNAELLNIPITMFETEIFEHVARIDKHPCFICARMRRGHLYKKAKELGCNKIALGHHFDDVIETILMGMFYGSQVQTMMPKLPSTFHPGMELIRPLYLVRESDIISWAQRNNLEFIRCACKFTEESTIDEEKSKRAKMKKHLKESTDWKTPVVAAAFVNNKWYFGANQCDHTIPKKDLNERTELFYSTTTHAEINLLKRIGDIGETDTVYVSLFPCDKCMKTLINKGIKKIYYLDDHLDKNWSKRSHGLAEEKGIETIKVGEPIKEEKDNRDYSKYKYIYPPNARKQDQLDIMINKENNNEDPLAPKNLDQEAQKTVFETDHWCITLNRFPYENAKTQILGIVKDDVYKFEDLSKEAFDEVQGIINRLILEYNLDGGAFCWRYGNPAKSGASLKRLHFHVIMPEQDKKVRFPIGGNKSLKKGLIINEEKN